MTDERALEQPTHGGSYTRQPDGSLVRNEPPADPKDANVTQPPKSKTKGK
jgi:hypothetical protein